MTIGSRSSRRSSPTPPQPPPDERRLCRLDGVHDRSSRRFAGAVDCSAVHGKRHFAFVKADAVKEITVSENTSVSSLAKELDDQGVINYHSVFKLYLTLKHQTDTSVLAGAYQLNPSMDYGQIVDALANTASTETVQITIPEGYSISQIRQVLLDNHICTEDALDEVLNDYSFKHDFLKDEKTGRGRLAGRLSVPGYL